MKITRKAMKITRKAKKANPTGLAIQPLKDYTICRKIVKPPTGMLVLPDECQDNEFFYAVTHIGQEVRDVVVGDVVVIWPDAPKRPIDYEGIHMYRVKETEILYKETK